MSQQQLHTAIRTATLGFPRMGTSRELKFALEAFWRGERTEEELQTTARTLRSRHWHRLDSVQ
jgi:5-methyltetrahydropteroyltriglutamate--homocysteine methyltransferase